MISDNIMKEQAVIDIIKRIFTYYDYSVKSSEISDLLAEKDGERLFIKYQPTISIDSTRVFSINVKKYNGKGLLISDSFDEETRMFALDEGLTLWDKDELESWIGRAVLSGALTESTRLDIQNFPVDKEEYERTARLSLSSLPVNIGKSDVISFARTKIGMITSLKLKFVPVWYYHYSFSTQKKYLSRIVDLSGKGEGYIHAITGENSFTEYRDISDNIFVPTQNYEILQPLIEKKDAITRAKDAIAREYTKDARINEMIGDTIVFQHKIFTPEPEDINLKIQLVYIPVWQISSKNRTIEINAYNGKPMRTQTYENTTFKSRATCDDAEFV